MSVAILEILFLSHEAMFIFFKPLLEINAFCCGFVMGSFDGAETCELVGCYILSLLTEKYGNGIGLYRDDGLSAFNKSLQEIEKIKKDICKIFRDNDLKITVEANLTKVNFLDVTLDLHKQSNHPPSILRNIPESINKRLSEISSDKDCFDMAKGAYQDALNKSGYKYNLSFKKPTSGVPRKCINRQRNILWFNPPYSQNVETKVGKSFLQLIDQCFPKTNPLHKIFNRNTLKLSYSCISHVKTIISSHNKAQLNKPSNQSDEIDNNCNCRNKNTCPLEGNCNIRNIIYQAEVETPQTKETYIGLCDTTFNRLAFLPSNRIPLVSIIPYFQSCISSHVTIIVVSCLMIAPLEA